ncbi:FecR family protein [Sanguibacteroides sp. AM78-02pH3A]|uniref:FecR family protein n=1 Tax=Sanguibacteroides sp. AM78-02pH3A TaxID=3002646 RepID=UPI0022E1A491|nr:FecR family protein [Sanguibacteroides sp. AM78-02pH3A]
MKNYIYELITKFFNKRHDPDIETKIQRWLIEGEHTRPKNRVLSHIWEQIDGKANAAVYQSLKEVNTKIGMRSSRGRSLRHLTRRVAAVLVPLFVLTGILIYQSSQIKTIEVITLAGEQKEIKLPDGSTVWLNACGKISYPEKFNDTLRRVTLTGEAYFSVVRSEYKRFEVSTKDISVEVLGTQFNVKAYPEDTSITTTLISGKVAVSLPEEKYMLRPNQKLVYNTVDKNTSIQEVSNNPAYWRDGSLLFNELTLREILTELERRFDVKFTLSQTILSGDRYSIKFNNKEGLNQILSVLQEVTGNFTYTTNGKTITIIIK